MRRRVGALALGLALLALTAPVEGGAAVARRRSPPVSVSGAPRSLVTLVVPVPAEVGSLERVQYQVAMSGGVEVIGRLSGVLEPATGQRSVMLTLRVPAVAFVGLLDVADVLFTTETGVSVAVPIILRIPAIRALRVSGMRELAALSGGDRVELAYQVQNLGNDDERLRVVVDAPADWGVRIQSGESIIVPAYGSATVVLRFRVPPVQTAGTFNVAVRLERPIVRDTSAAAVAQTLLRVNEPVARGEVLAMHPFFGAATSADGSAMSAGMRITGPLTEGLAIDAAFAPPPPTNIGLAGLGLANVGLGQVPLRASLIAEHWRAELGVVNGLVAPLAGNGFGGRGGSLRGRNGNTEYYAVAAVPQLQRSTRGLFVAAAVQQATSRGRVGVTLSSLDERTAFAGVSSRSLNALSAQWSSDTLFQNLSLGGGVALRQFGGRTGLGVSMDATHQGERSQLRGSAMIAPGGSAAFAPAERRFALDAQRRLSDDLFVDAFLSTARDVSLLQTASRFTNGSVGVRRFLGQRANVSGRVGRDASRGTGFVGVGGFHTVDNYVASGLAFGIGGWGLSVDGRASVVERSTVLFSGARDERRAGQQSLNLSANRSFGALGQFSLGGNVSSSGTGVGAPEGAVSAIAQWNDFPLALGDVIVRLSQEVRVARTSLLAPRLAYRTGATTVVHGFDITTSFERSPFLTDRRGRPAWMVGLRVALSAQLLATERLTSSGTVYRDANGNGRRDDGEGGVAGVVLTHDRVRATTNRRGEYRIPASSRGRLTILPTSIPPGLLMHPRLLSDTAEHRDIPLVPAGTMVVRLEQEVDDSTRAVAIDFSRVDVWMVDPEGFEWVARHVGDGRFAFEHVPAGAYQLRTNFARTGEQLRAQDQQLRIGGGENPEIRVPVRGRSIRIITPPAGAPGRGRIGPRNGGNRTQR